MLHHRAERSGRTEVEGFMLEKGRAAGMPHERSGLPIQPSRRSSKEARPVGSPFGEVGPSFAGPLAKMLSSHRCELV